jgi:hypothetical protein
MAHLLAGVLPREPRVSGGPPRPRVCDPMRLRGGSERCCGPKAKVEVLAHNEGR